MFIRNILSVFSFGSQEHPNEEEVKEIGGKRAFYRWRMLEQHVLEERKRGKRKDWLNSCRRF